MLMECLLLAAKAFVSEAEEFATHYIPSSFQTLDSLLRSALYIAQNSMKILDILHGHTFQSLNPSSH